MAPAVTVVGRSGRHPGGRRPLQPPERGLLGAQDSSSSVRPLLASADRASLSLLRADPAEGRVHQPQVAGFAHQQQHRHGRGATTGRDLAEADWLRLLDALLLITLHPREPRRARARTPPDRPG
ncbi:hypothetical protein [Saccharothrix xinjiangensis]|uniref:Uncharacterized protein n=1 Tax=Saccharothrix xinjiangensis TaxID=204798 RepID=A0ABV9Y8Z1_9PSEU